MKKIGIVFLLCLILAGCGVQETFETLSDTYDIPAVAQVRQIQLELPEDASMMTMGSGMDSKLYICDGYSVSTHVLDGGDLERTFRQTTGFDKDALTVMETQLEGYKRYDCVWSAAGEGGDQICRGVLLDDGQQHYTVTLSADASKAGELADVWQKILDSVRLNTD